MPNKLVVFSAEVSVSWLSLHKKYGDIFGKGKHVKAEKCIWIL